MQEARHPYERARTLALATYFGAVALTSVAYIATFQNAAVLAPQITGTPATGGLPSSAAVAGTALAALLLSSLMASRGRRLGIMAGIGLAIVGSSLTVVADLAWSFLVLIAGALLIGFGNAAINLSRYAAADLFPANRRAWAVGVVVWGSTFGAVAGPNLAAPANALGESAGLPHAAGGFLMAVAFLVTAGLLATFGPRAPEQHQVAGGTTADEAAPVRSTVREMLSGLASSARGRAAVSALISGQLVMVLIMTMTPYQLNHTGHADATIGLVISAHTLGMFALSPISGRLAERFGAPNVILAGFATLALAGVLGAATPASSGTVLMLPLFLLGFGWNMTFVAGSSMLTSGESYADRARLQGLVDASVWGTAALAGISAGFVVQLAGYAVLCSAGAALSVLLASAIVFDRRTARPAEG